MLGLTLRFARPSGEGSRRSDATGTRHFTNSAAGMPRDTTDATNATPEGTQNRGFWYRLLGPIGFLRPVITNNSFSTLQFPAGGGCRSLMRVFCRHTGAKKGREMVRLKVFQLTTVHIQMLGAQRKYSNSCPAGSFLMILDVEMGLSPVPRREIFVRGGIFFIKSLWTNGPGDQLFSMASAVRRPWHRLGPCQPSRYHKPARPCR